MTQPDPSFDPTALQCPVPLRDYPHILLGHGGGGRLSQELIEHVFLRRFQNETLSQLGDSAVLPMPSGRIAFSTDSYVVQPLFFPGGSIGELAVHGTVNDLAMSGAVPIALSAAFILEEGFSIDRLDRIVDRMANAAREVGVPIATGDTKVVQRGHGDGCYINTSGIGVIPDHVQLSIRHARPGDAVLVSGTIGDHGMAIMSVREGLEFEAPIQSDTAALHTLVQSMLSVSPKLRALRDPTRGGVATSLNEIAGASRVGIAIEDRAVPVLPAVQSACEILGLDPLLVANEGKLIAIVPSEDADAVLHEMRRHPLGAQAVRIGTVVSDHPGLVVAKTALGANRVVPMPLGEQLPRIC